MVKAEHFDKYLTTHFNGQRDIKAAYRSYEGDYGSFLPNDKNAAILDIGCGTGVFINYLRSKGYTNVSGVDASREMVDFCSKSGIGSVILVHDLASHLLTMPQTFDLIALNDTIEHFPKEDTVDILKAVRTSLRKGGLLLVRTGNFSTLAGTYLRYKDFTHEIAYTESSLAQVLRMAGFDDIEIRGNRYYVTGIRSLLRVALLRLWFLVLKAVYLVEMGSDSPRICSKLLIGICRNR